MDSIPIVSFRYFGRYGHFRKPYSNVSSFTYPFPPRTAIAGLLGAILGVPKEKVAGNFDESKMKVAVAIEKKIKTITHVTNLRQDSSGKVDYSIKRPRTDWPPKPLKRIPDWNKPINPYPMELVRNPSYLLYVSLNDKMSELTSRLKNERYVYTPCLGLSEFLAGLQSWRTRNIHGSLQRRLFIIDRPFKTRRRTSHSGIKSTSFWNGR
jgi:CRISPR-associated protein Cas5h